MNRLYKNLILIFIGVGLSLSGCTQIKNILSKIQNPSASVSETVTGTSQEESEGLNRANRELVSEMMMVIYDQAAISDSETYHQWVNSLNQGASLEGVYRGMVMAPKYQGLEGQSPAASPLAIKVFALELSEIQEEMQNPTQVSALDKKPIEIEFPDENSALHSANQAQSPSGKKLNKEERAQRYVQNFVGASVFTLKRVLCDEVLKRMEEVSKSSNASLDRAQFFSKLASRMSQIRLKNQPIDFGLPQRNNPDVDFHFKWAEKAPVDRVLWEVLNRYQRLMNNFAQAE